MSFTDNFISKYKKFFEIIFFLLIYLLICSPLILKTALIENTIYNLSNKKFLGLIETIKRDSPIYIALIAMLYVGVATNIRNIASIIIKVSILIIFFISLTDYFVIFNFGNKLHFEDIMQYGSYSFKYIGQIYGRSTCLWALFFLTSACIIIFIFFKKYKIKENKALNFVTIFVISAFAIIPFCFKSDKSEFEMHKVLLKYASSSSSKNTKYSQEFIDNFSFTEEKICKKSPKKSPNIIILMVESLSSYHSKFFSNINNLTPNLDKIATNNIAFTNFYANGSFTEHGEIALLTGLPFIQPPKSKFRYEYSFNSFFNLKRALPKVLKKENYYSEFLTTADLNFANTGEWLKSIGFDYAEDSENEFYDDYEKFIFNATADEFLLKRVFERVTSKSDQPRFTFVKTVTSHTPYIHPVKKIQSEYGAIEYVDEEIGNFYTKLKSNFFDNGILIIVGDHHAPKAPIKEEVEKYGYIPAQSMVPLIISFGDKKAEVVNQQFQQADVYNGIKNMISGESCYSNWIGDVFDTKQSPKYILFQREDRKNLVTIFEQNKVHEMRIDGDNTKLITNLAIDKVQEKYFVDKVNSFRVLPIE